MPEPHKVKGIRQEVEDQLAFQESLRLGRKALWWQNFIKTIQQRKHQLVEELLAGVHDQRVEDRIRGQASELNFILSLDQVEIPEPRREETRDGDEDQQQDV